MVSGCGGEQRSQIHPYWPFLTLSSVTDPFAGGSFGSGVSGARGPHNVAHYGPVGAPWTMAAGAQQRPLLTE